jgi:hypothetical protein
MKKTSSVSSFATRLKTTAPTPVAQSAAATSPVRRPKKAAVRRKTGKMVSEPKTMLGRRMAASSLTSSRRRRSPSAAREFQARAALTEAKMSAFINIGCSAFSVKSPRA